MDWNILMTAVAGGCTTIIGIVASYFATKKKYNVEVRSQEIDNLKRIIEIQAEQIRSLAERQTLVLERNKKLEEEILELRRQMFNLMGSICYDFTCRHRISQQQEEIRQNISQASNAQEVPVNQVQN